MQGQNLCPAGFCGIFDYRIIVPSLRDFAAKKIICESLRD